MGSRVHVKGVTRKDPRLDLYVLAVIELAREIEAEKRAARSAEGGEL